MVRVQALNKAGWPSEPSDTLTFTASDGNDANGDGLPDDWASAYGITGGADGDADGDGLKNGKEFDEGTNPVVADTDGDGFTDGEEVAADTNAFDRASYGGVISQPRLALASDRLTFPREAPDRRRGRAADHRLEQQWRRHAGARCN